MITIHEKVLSVKTSNQHRYYQYTQYYTTWGYWRIFPLGVFWDLGGLAHFAHCGIFGLEGIGIFCIKKIRQEKLLQFEL